jgi:hypothetical protein
MLYTAWWENGSTLLSTKWRIFASTKVYHPWIRGNTVTRWWKGKVLLRITWNTLAYATNYYWMMNANYSFLPLPRPNITNGNGKQRGNTNRHIASFFKHPCFKFIFFLLQRFYSQVKCAILVIMFYPAFPLVLRKIPFPYLNSVKSNHASHPA